MPYLFQFQYLFIIKKKITQFQLEQLAIHNNVCQNKTTKIETCSCSFILLILLTRL